MPFGMQGHSARSAGNMLTTVGTTILNTKSKCVVAVLGTTIIAAVLWNRGQPEDQLLRYQLHGDDRVLHRSRRQAVGNNLNNIFNTFSSVQGCCKVPNLLPQLILNSCTPPAMKKAQKAQKATNKKQAQDDQGWFGAIRNFYNPQPNIKVVKARKGRDTSAKAKISFDSICFSDCVFNALGFFNLTAANALDVEKIDLFFTEKSVDAGQWKDVIVASVKACEKPAACATPEAVPHNNRYCNTKPTVMMNCMRQYMLTNCPGAVKSYQCSEGMNKVRKLSVLSLV